MSFFDDLWNSISNVLDQIWTAINAVLPYILIIAALCMTLGWSGFALAYLLPGSAIVISGWWGAALCLGLAYLLNPTETLAIVAKVVTFAADLVKTVVGAAASALGLPAILAIGLGAWLITRQGGGTQRLKSQRGVRA
jgi:hypothetical protein